MRNREEENRKGWEEKKRARKQQVQREHERLAKNGKAYTEKERAQTEAKFYGQLNVQLIRDCRAHCINKDSPLVRKHPWLQSIPYDIRDNVLRDLKKARKTTKSLLQKNKKGQYFHWKRINMKSRKAFTTNLEVNVKHLKAQRGAYAQLFHRSSYKTRVSEKNQEKGHSCFPLEDASHSVRVSLDGNGKWHAYVPVPLEYKSGFKDTVPKVVSIDPGVRSFMTVYEATTGDITEWCPGDASSMFQSLLSIDKLVSKQKKLENRRQKMSPKEKALLRSKFQSLRDKRKSKREKRKKRSKKARTKRRQKMIEKRKRQERDFKMLQQMDKTLTGRARPRKFMAAEGPRTRWRLKRAIRRKRLQLQNKVKEVHHKFAKWLLDTFDCILLPAFQSAKMSKKKQENGKGRKIGKKTTRQMLNWCHFSFREFLLHKVREYPGKRVVICDEAYTSKCCGQCGSLNDSLGSSKVFKCRECSYVADRDDNGARNVLLRYLSRLEKVSSLLSGTEVVRQDQGLYGPHPSSSGFAVSITSPDRE